jgi:hypothetical protein
MIHKKSRNLVVKAASGFLRMFELMLKFTYREKFKERR